MALQERLSLLLVHCLGISLAISPYLLLLSEAENDTLSQGQHLQGQDLLTSKLGVFKFGFFTRTFPLGYYINSESCSNRYLGIWYMGNVKKPVWVANRENPVPDSSGVVTMDSDGILRLTYSGGKRINISSSNNNVVTSAATLLDSGNLVVRQVYYSSNGSRFGRVLWQSFDYPTDSFLPGMKLGMNLRTNQTWFLTSWLSDQVPAPGAFKLGVDGRSSSSSPELVMWWHDSVYWTSGPWINGSFANASELIEGTDEVGLEYKFVTNENEKYFTYFYKDISPVTSITSRAWVLDDLIKLTDFFTTIYQYPLSTCDQKQEVCLKKNSSECRNDSKHYFVPSTNNFVGNLVEYDNNTSLGLSDCHAFCWNNCSCHGYEALFPNGTGCSLWDDVLGLTSADQSSGKTAYFLNTLLRQLESPGEAPVQSPGQAPVKSPAESSGRGQIKKDSPGSMKDWWWWWIGSLIAIIPALAMLLFGFLCHQRRRNLKRKQQTKERERSHDGADKLKFNTTKAQHLQLYSFLQIAAATDNFSSVNKLGQGGFGPVYKGVLSDGHHIAIKRLSRSSGQGIVEFKNEITLIAELQHMNLVKLLGCCIQQEEKMLIYEYMPNKSLDFFLFDPTKSKLLDWKKRLNIIEGIAQGLLYLHKYSRMRVIHRDLKASNILLDDEMNPKISDFGLARIFGQNENEANTNRVVGTYGYMSPEYAMNGIFSVKSDVYSFGVLLLEIVSGKKNTSFSSLSGPLSLIEHVWDLWKKGISVELMDPSLNFSCPETQMLRCIHVGLLCVQECAVDRPTMSDLIAMLTNETLCLPDPKQPAFYTGRRTRNAQNLPAENKSEDCSVNRVSMSVLEAR